MKNLFTKLTLSVVAAHVLSLCCVTSVSAATRNVGHLHFANNYSSQSLKVELFHRQSTHRVWKGISWTIPAGRTSRLATGGANIKVRGDWEIRVTRSDGKKSRKRRIADVGAHMDGGYWKIFATDLVRGKSPRVALPVKASRGSSSWYINSQGVVESRIKYTVGSGSGSKKYTTALIVEFADGSIYTAFSTKTIGRPLYGSKKGTHRDLNHRAIPYTQLSKIRRCYVRYSTSSSGPATLREWINEARVWVREGGEIYKELKENELVRDAVKIGAGL